MKIMIDTFTVQDIRDAVVGYIRDSGEHVEDYDVDAIVDNLASRRRLEGFESYCDYFEVAVFEHRVAEV